MTRGDDVDGFRSCDAEDRRNDDCADGAGVITGVPYTSGGAKGRQSAAHILERRLWRDWERALRELQNRADRLERTRSKWKGRLARAMRGIDPDTWWRTNRRVEVGELWVAHNPEARRVQRVVHVTRPTVLALALCQKNDLHQLAVETATAELGLREATYRLLAAANWDRALTVLAVDPGVLGNLTGPGPILTGTLSALCRGERP
jgi:hypothetical protein